MKSRTSNYFQTIQYIRTMAFVALSALLFFFSIQNAFASSKFNDNYNGYGRDDSSGSVSTPCSYSKSTENGVSRGFSSDNNSPTRSSEPCSSPGGRNGDALQKQLDETLKRIEQLRAQIAALNHVTPGSGGSGNEKDDHHASTTPDRPKPGNDSAHMCKAITLPLRFGDKDANKGGEVSSLQSMLAEDPSIYPEGDVTGFFGEGTRKAIQRFQSRNGVVSSGNEKSTGYGSVGGKTRDMFLRNFRYKCQNKKDILKVSDINGIVVTTNNQDESANVAVDVSTTTDFSFKIGSTTRAKMLNVIGMRLDTEYRFKFATTSNNDTRYAVLAPLTTWKQTNATTSCEKRTEINRCKKTYTLDDVKTITSRNVDPIPNAADDEYTLFTITLKDGTTRELRRGFTPPGTFEKSVRDSGYTGDIPALLAKATTGSVLGASTSSPEYTLLEIQNGLEALLKLSAQLR